MPGTGPSVKNQPGRSHAGSGDGRLQEDVDRATSFDLLRRVILGLIRAIGEGAELVSTSLAEELVRFRHDIEHRLVVVLLVSSGVVLLSIGVIVFLRDLIGSWPVTLLLVGGTHVGVGLWLSHRWKQTGDAK